MDNETFEKLQRVMGVDNAKVFLKAMQRDKQFKKAIETPIGVELLSDVVANMESIFELIINEKDSLETRAELKAYRKILGNWSRKINEADKAQNIITKL